MTEQQISLDDRRKRSQERLAALVASRTETLVRYSSLAGIRPYRDDEDTGQALRSFCQSLIDYAASAHFQLYRYIADGKERRQAVRAIAEQIYPQIAASTDAILNFNDRYDVSHLDGARIEALADELSRLGEMLADRISLEDEVIQAMSGPKR